MTLVSFMHVTIMQQASAYHPADNRDGGGGTLTLAATCCRLGSLWPVPGGGQAGKTLGHWGLGKSLISISMNKWTWFQCPEPPKRSPTVAVMEMYEGR